VQLAASGLALWLVHTDGGKRSAAFCRLAAATVLGSREQLQLADQQPSVESVPAQQAAQRW